MPKGLQGFQKGHKLFRGVEKGYFKKGNTPYNKDKKCPEISGENNGVFKGEKAKYTAKHMWIRYHYGIADKCENKNCHYPKLNTRGIMLEKPKKYNWANISKKYKRNINDWIMLCPNCHQQWDRGLIKIKITIWRNIKKQSV